MTNQYLNRLSGVFPTEHGYTGGNLITVSQEVQSYLEASTIFIQSEVSILSAVLNSVEVQHVGMILPTGVAAPAVWLDGLPT